MAQSLDVAPGKKDTKNRPEKSVLIVNHVSPETQRLLQENQDLQEEIRSLHEQLYAARSQLEQANRLATLGNIGAGIAHELNNPLTVISGEADEILDNIEERLLDKHQLLISAQNIKKCTHRMRAIIDHIREYARKEQYQRWERLSIDAVLNNALLLVKSQLQNSGIVVRVRLEESLPQIWGDPTKLESVFQNILGNARDAFETICDAREKQITVSAGRNADSVIIRIVDNAGGIPEEIQTNIFDAFFTTKEKGKGTGLGLSIALTIIKEHQGTIEVHSTPGEGTEFVISLPVTRNPQATGDKDVKNGKQKHSHR